MKITTKLKAKIQKLYNEGQPTDADYQDTIGDWHQLGDGQWHHIFYIDTDTYFINGQEYRNVEDK